MRHLRFIWSFIPPSLPNVFIALILLALSDPWRKGGLARRGRKTALRHEVGLACIVAYTALVLSVTLDLYHVWVSLCHGWPLPAGNWMGGGFSLSPISIWTSPWDAIMWFANVTLFIPFGLLIPLLWDCDPGRWVGLICFSLSLFIELGQLLLGWSGRAFDVSDLLCNTLGGLLGWLIWRAFRQHFSAFTTSFRVGKEKLLSI